MLSGCFPPAHPQTEPAPLPNRKGGFHEQIQKTRIEHADFCDRLVRLQDSAAAAHPALHRKPESGGQQHQGTAG